MKKYPIILSEKQRKERERAHKKKLEKVANDIMKMLAKEECKVGDFTIVVSVINKLFNDSFNEVEIEKINAIDEE